MFLLAVSCGWLTAFFLSFYLTNATNTLYCNHGGQNGFYLYTYRFRSNGNDILYYPKYDRSNQMKNAKLWLLVDSVLTKMLHAKYWATSLDPYKQDIDQAIIHLREARRKLEEEK